MKRSRTLSVKRFLGLGCACCFGLLVAGPHGGCGCATRDADRPFGDTAVVVVLNPAVNDGNTTTVPTSWSTQREGVVVDAVPGGSATTDATGLAVIEEVVAGEVEIQFDAGPLLGFQIVSNGDVYDLAAAYNGSEVAAYPNFPIRYGVGGEIVVFNSNASPDAVAQALSTNHNIVFFQNGTYHGDLLITGDDVIFFGEGFAERQVVIDGSVTVRGTGVRIRGFTITGNITLSGNDFGMAFTVVRGETQILGNAVAFLRNAFYGPVTVPSSNATLLDNEGMSPLGDPAEELCQ